MRVVKRVSQNLPAGDVFVGGGNTPSYPHGCRVHGQGRAKAAQRGAEGPQQKNGFHKVASGLFYRQRGKFRRVQRAFGHHPVHRQGKLLHNLIHAEFRHRGIAPAHLSQQPVGGVDGFFAAFYSNIHIQDSDFCGMGLMPVVRGKPAMMGPLSERLSSSSSTSTPRG